MTMRTPPDQDVVIAGVTGNLARRKLLPALYDLACKDLLPRRGAIAGSARAHLSGDEFRSLAREAVEASFGPDLDEGVWSRLAARMAYASADMGLGALRERCILDRRLLYLSTPPSAFQALVREAGESGLAEGASIVIEKPFGHDLASARELDAVVHEVFEEDRVYRIDHFLGKETVQNILVLRFANVVFERVWNRDAVDHVQLTIAEAEGIDGRAAFYEETGAVRDMVQNHAFQVLSLLAMEPPASFRAEDVRNEKVKLFRSILPVNPAELVRGQYGPGRVNGREVPGYRDETGVSEGSMTETFAALTLYIDNWRWAGVPFYIRTGKRLARRDTEISIAFKEAPTNVFQAIGISGLEANRLTICIQPDETILLYFLAKRPGPDIALQPVKMEFSYEDSFMHDPSEAYERLIHDALVGDRTLFARADGVLRCWEVLQPVLDRPPPVCHYPAGSWGPLDAFELIAPRTWHVR